MLKKVFLVILIGLGIYLIYPSFINPKTPLLILNMSNVAKLPKNFRLMTDPFTNPSVPPPSRKGLDTLKASGSAQFSQKSLQEILAVIPSDTITLVDLRRESHGFINGAAVSWYLPRNWVNKDMTLSEVEQDEQQRLNQARAQKLVISYLYRKIPRPFFVHTIATERQLAQAYQLGYERILVQDHVRPTDEAIDQFIAFIKTLPKETWLHFHCSAGRGRTTTFLAMYDMIRNAKDVSLKDILLRQEFLMGIPLFDPTVSAEWKWPYAIERSKLVKLFYQYCRENPNLEISWTAWLQKR